MSIKYSCFISYPHPQEEGNEILKKFMEQLKKDLRAALGLYFKDKGVYMDDLHSAGDDFENRIAEAICQSICMIVVFAPIYTESLYCLREFCAMENVEEKRKQKLGIKFDRKKRMIIPIILRGNPDDLPHKIKNIHYYDFSQFTLESLKISKKNKALIENIAKVIHEHYKNIKDIYRDETHDETNDECKTFLLPSENEALKHWGSVSTSEIKEALKNWGSVSTSEIGFPGRSNI